jgi:hypothetical protein
MEIVIRRDAVKQILTVFFDLEEGDLYSFFKRNDAPKLFQ